MHSISAAAKQELARSERRKTIAVILAATLVLAGCGSKSGTGGNAGGNVGVTTQFKKPMKKGDDQTVRLHWKDGKWWVNINGGPDKDPSTATSDLKKDVGPSKFEVTIAGKSTTFAAADPLQVWEDSKTSNPPGTTQILGPDISRDGKKLTFYDLNQGPAMKLYYSITLANGEKIDPIIDNGGGGNMATN